MNKELALTSTDEGIQILRALTSSFKKYLENYDLRYADDKIEI
jgi:hypothetical protein